MKLKYVLEGLINNLEYISNDDISLLKEMYTRTCTNKRITNKKLKIEEKNKNDLEDRIKAKKNKEDEYVMIFKNDEIVKILDRGKPCYLKTGKIIGFNRNYYKVKINITGEIYEINEAFLIKHKNRIY